MQTTRRALLAGTGAALAATAGCLGSIEGGGGGGSGGDTDCDLSAREPVQSLPAPSMGPDDAGVTIMAFEDFACPHCRTYHLEEFPSVESELVGDGVRYEHHDLPIPVSEQWSWAAAGAARAVQDASDDATESPTDDATENPADDTTDDAAFFDYAASLFENQSSYSMSLVQSLAEDVGADGCDVRAAATNGRYRPVLEADRQRGIEMGVEGTPTVFVNGRQVNATFDAIRQAVENAR